MHFKLACLNSLRGHLAVYAGYANMRTSIQLQEQANLVKQQTYPEVFQTYTVLNHFALLQVALLLGHNCLEILRELKNDLETFGLDRLVINDLLYPEYHLHMVLQFLLRLVVD